MVKKVDIVTQIAQCQKKLSGLRFQAAVEEAVLQRLQALDSAAVPDLGLAAARAAAAAGVISGSLPDRIATFLRTHGKAARANEIADALVKQGAAASPSMVPQIFATLARRKDLFRRARRGVYALRK